MIIGKTVEKVIVQHEYWTIYLKVDGKHYLIKPHDSACVEANLSGLEGKKIDYIDCHVYDSDSSARVDIKSGEDEFFIKYEDLELCEHESLIQEISEKDMELVYHEIEVYEEKMEEHPEYFTQIK